MASDPNTALTVHPERLRGALDPRLSDATIARLVSCRRLRDRIEGVLGLEAPTSEPVPDGFAWLIDDPAAAARRAGALLHARALREILSGPEVAALAQAIGRDAHAFGLRHAAEAGPRPHEGALADAILREGFACLGAWLARQPPALRAAVLLRLPPGSAAESEPSDASIRAQADAVMARVREAASGSDA